MSNATETENAPKREIDNILDLAKAREILLIDAERYMPADAHRQREHYIAIFNEIISNALANTPERLPDTMPEKMDDISSNAWRFVAETQEYPIATDLNGQSAYQKLEHTFAQRKILMHSGNLIEWMLAAKGIMEDADADTMGAAHSAIKLYEQRVIAQPATQPWLEEAANDTSLDEAQRRNLELMQKIYLERAGLNENLARRCTEAAQASERAWRKARSNDGNTDSWLPKLKNLVEAMQEKARAMSTMLGVSPYEALMGDTEFNAGLPLETVDRFLGELQQEIPKLIRQVMEKQSHEEPPIPLPEIAKQDLERIGYRIMEKMGLNRDHCRLDSTPHPFTIGDRDDVRISTIYNGDYDPGVPVDPLMITLRAIVHEAGHALYSRAMPTQWGDQPISEYQSIWLHETQSFFWENLVMKSPEFSEFLSKLLKEELGENSAFEPQNLFKLLTRVEPGPIRFCADEVTYPAHIVQRHNLAKQLVSGELDPMNLPEAWNAELKKMLGDNLDIPDNRRGCLQEMHFAYGLLGYHVGYTVGAVGAAQLMEKAKTDLAERDLDVKELIRTGDFAPMREWLNENIHRHGSRYDGLDLIEQVTGKPLSTEPFLNHLKERYLGVTPNSSIVSDVLHQPLIDRVAPDHKPATAHVTRR